MAKLSNRESMWNKISRSVFQDRTVSYEKFIEAIINPIHPEHQSITAQTLMMLPAATFVDLLGKKSFIENWTTIKESTEITRNSVNDSVVILDNLWSYIVTGFSFIQPKASIKKPLPNKLQSTFLEISSKSKGVSIYDIKKKTGRSYNRVYEDVSKLENLGLVSTNLTKVNNRDVKMVNLSFT